MLEIPQKESLLSRYKTVMISIAVLITLGILALFSINELQAEDSPDVVYSVAEKGTVKRKVVGQGRLSSSKTKTLISEVEGVVSEINLQPGTLVQPGDVVLHMQNPELQRIYEQAQLNVLGLTAEHKANIANLETEEVKLLNAVELAKSDVAYSKQELFTLASLVDSGGVAKLDHVRAESRFGKAKLQLELVQRNLAIFERTKTARLEASQYRLLVAEKQLSLANQDVERLVIAAASSGTLGSFSEAVELGKLLQRGEVIGQITDQSSLILEFFISASDASEIDIKQKIEASLNNHLIHAEVVRIHPNVDNNLVQVEAKFTEKLPSFARENTELLVTVIVEEAQGVVRIKTPSNMRLIGTHLANQHIENTNQLSVVIEQNGELKEKVIQVGVIGKEYTEVISGLSVGEKVIVSPQVN